MKFKCKAADLQKGISIVEKAVSSKSTLPVLENIFFEVQEGSLKLRGNDLEIGIENIIPLQSSEVQGKILIKAKTISNIVSKLKQDDLLFDVHDNQKIKINASDQLAYDILGMDSAEYPIFPAIEEGNSFSISSRALSDLIKSTLFSASHDETKHFLNGILLSMKEEALTFVATDGYRLALKKSSSKIASSDFSVIAPFKAMNEIFKILQTFEEDSQIQVTVSENQISFRMKETLFISRLIQGQFPDYQQVLPQESQQSFSVSRKLLLEASERASIIASASNNVVRLAFQNEQVEITANAIAMGDFKEEIPIQRLSGAGDSKIAFNVRLVMDAIKVMDDEDVRLEFNNELSPCVVRPVTGEDFVYIIMPIRTNDYQASPEPAGG